MRLTEIKNTLKELTKKVDKIENSVNKALNKLDFMLSQDPDNRDLGDVIEILTRIN